jgi:hypothetical protein
MSDTSSGSRRSSAKSSAKPGAKAPTKKNAGRQEVLASDGVLANLPRTRPQRSSARRDAARRTISAEAKPTGAPARRQRQTTAAKAQPTAAAKGQPIAAAGHQPRPAAEAQTQTPARRQTAAKKRPAKTKATATHFQDPAPRQGFETERDPVSGPVSPPGGVDLFASAAELAGELTKSGLSTGGRLLKDVFARLPLN